MHIGYARTSTLYQVAGFEAQQRDLSAAGCEKVYCEQVSSVARRAELEAAIEFARESDCLVVTRPDRLCKISGRPRPDRRTAGCEGRDAQGIGAQPRHCDADRTVDVESPVGGRAI